MYSYKRCSKGMIVVLALLASAYTPPTWAHAQLDFPMVDVITTPTSPAIVIDLDTVFSNINQGTGLPHSETINFSVVGNTDPAVINVDFSGSILTLTPLSLGTATITVEAEGTGGDDVFDDITVTVVDTNAPVATPTSETFSGATYVEDMAPITIVLSAIFSDPDGDALTFSLGSSSGGSILTAGDPSSGTVILTPIANASGTQTFVFIATDIFGASATFTPTFVLTQVNDDPFLVGGGIADVVVAEDTATVSVSIGGIFDDVDLAFPGDSHTVSVNLNDNPALVTSTNSLFSLSGSLTFSVTPNANGNAGITVEATDSQGASVQTSFTITVTPLNDAPTVVSAILDQVHVEDGGNLSVSFAGVFDDVDLAIEGDTQSFSVLSVGNPTLITAAAISGTDVILTFGAEQNGSSTVEIEVQDSAGASVSDTFTVNVTPVDDPPFVQNPIGVVAVDEDAADTVIDLYNLFDDPDIATNGDVLTFVIVSNDNPTLFALISVVGGAGSASLVLDYGDNQFGNANLVVEATDSTGLTATDAFSVVITEVFPTASDDSVSMNEDDPELIIDVLANDDPGETPTLIIAVGRTWTNPLTGETVDQISESDPTTV